MRPTPLTVSQLNNYIKTLVDRDEFLNNVYIKGEISNFKRHYTGHLYFTLKDGDSLIKCVMFKTYTSYLKFEPEDGMSVLILGTVAVYERDGVYQIYAKGMEADGLGALHVAYEQLKEKLAAKGMFAEEHKKKIPILPKSIGVVTSKTGSVVKDIINVTTRRFPKVNIRIYPAAVQGEGAAETIVTGIKYFNEMKNVDTIIIARGGGSLEDLWPFNEEITANAIFESEIPIISAVGHETDFTIADFVADLRAPTPSAAGELAVPDINEITWKLANIRRNLSTLLNKKIEVMEQRYKRIINSVVFKNPTSGIRQRVLSVDAYSQRLESAIQLKNKNVKINLTKLISKLDGLSPLKTLSRGYSVIQDKDNNVIKSVKELKKDDKINLVLNDGNATAQVL
ncbi:MAG: exodeoxyribonuclease VII large subunit [Clostridia bacterium]|nr:exodeoxyribonuclease VII large subunit [Clostridia bacterium]